MVEERARRVWADLLDQFGDDLRVVTRYDAADFETVMREDVRELYTPTEDREIVDNTVIRQLQVSGEADAFETGDLECLVRVFEDAYVIHYPDTLDGKSGYIVSIERGQNGTTAAAVDECIEYFERTDG